MAAGSCKKDVHGDCVWECEVKMNVGKGFSKTQSSSREESITNGDCSESRARAKALGCAMMGVLGRESP